MAYTASRSDGEERAFLVGRGSPGEELNGSNAGKRRFTPVFEGELCWVLILLGDESIIADIYQDLCLGESLSVDVKTGGSVASRSTTLDIGGIVCGIRYFEEPKSRRRNVVNRESGKHLNFGGLQHGRGGRAPGRECVYE